MRRFTLLFLLSLLVSAPVWAGGPWVRPVRKGFAQLGFSGLYYNAVFNPMGGQRNVFRNNRDLTVQLYVEYGFAKNWEVRAVVPFKSLQTGPSENPALNPVPAGTLTGLGNLGLGLKRALIDGDVKLSLGVDALANTFRNDDRLGLRTGFEGWTVLPYLSLGSGTKRAYYYLEAGYGLMTQEYSNFVKVNGELGYRFGSRFWLAGTLDFRTPQRNGRFTNTEPYLLTAAYLNDQQFLGTGLKAAYDLKPERLGLSASVIGAIGGENVPFSRSYNVGIYLKW
jgi:hypothetical protein